MLACVSVSVFDPAVWATVVGNVCTVIPVQPFCWSVTAVVYVPPTLNSVDVWSGDELSPHAATIVAAPSIRMIARSSVSDMSHLLV